MVIGFFKLIISLFCESSVNTQVKYSKDMFYFSQLNVDYLNVGFYQSGPGGVTISRANIDNIYQRQVDVPESILLTYDPTRTSRGQMGLKAYQLSPDLLSSREEAERRLRLSTNTKVSQRILWLKAHFLSLVPRTFYD